MKCFLVILFCLQLLGCVSPRSHSILGLEFSDHAPRALMRVTCAGNTKLARGVFACEEKDNPKMQIKAKIPPLRGNVVFSDGLRKHVTDFNWGEEGFWFWKRTRLSEPWIPIDVGDLSSIYGDKPIQFNIRGQHPSSGIINNFGVVYHRTCNDRDIPCSRLIVNYDCAGEVENTWPGQLGYCSRMSGSPQEFSVPLKTIYYKIEAGSLLWIRNGRSGWEMEYTVTVQDVETGEIKFKMPSIEVGPQVILVSLFFEDQGVDSEIVTSILLSGYSPKWTGIDGPHAVKKNNSAQWYGAVTADVCEVIDMQSKSRKEIKSENGESLPLPSKYGQCGYCWHRESGDLSTSCVNGEMEPANHPAW